MINKVIEKICIYKDARVIPTRECFEKKHTELVELMHKYTILVDESKDTCDLKKQSLEMREYAVVYDKIMDAVAEMCAMTNRSNNFKKL